MRIIALEQPVPGIADTRFSDAILRAEAEAVWALYRGGAIRELYFRADRHAAVLFLEAADLAAARGIVEQLPLVRERLIEFELVPLEAYPGFERLFGR